jgi:L-threonylcarbamoyladenylate synthase
MRRRPSSYWLKIARTHLRRGGVIAYPTESCYGLGCLPKNAKALKKILLLKARPQNKGMIVVGATSSQLKPLLEINQEQFDYVSSVWPARTTFIISIKRTMLPILRGIQRDALAVRVPDLSITRELCHVLGSPLVSTSANKSKQKPIRQKRQLRIFKKQGVLLYPERIGNARSVSKIIDLKSGHILR